MRKKVVAGCIAPLRAGDAVLLSGTVYTARDAAHARLCELLPELQIADKRFEDIRLWNMLTHTSGLGDVSDYHWYDRETDADSLRRYRLTALRPAVAEEIDGTYSLVQPGELKLG